MKGRVQVSLHNQQLDDASVATLAALVSGPVLTPGSPGYAREVAVYNLAIEHHPAVVVGAAGAVDVQAAVRFANEHDLPVAVLSTGHQATSPADDAILINTSRMSSVTIDPTARRARVGAGARWQQVVEAAAEHGLAPLNGSSPLVGVVGYTLGGGLSPTMGRAFGWAADHVSRIEVVTADGEIRNTTTETEPDLFWALLGGKSNFGVVTELEFALFPVTRLYAGGLFFAGEHAAAVLHAYRAFAESAPEQVSSSIALLRLPELPFIPELLRGRFTVHIRFSFLGPGEDGESLAAPLRAAAPALIDTVGEMPYSRFAEIHSDPVDPAPFAERSAMLKLLTPEAVEKLIQLAGPDADCPAAFVELRQLGGALSRAGAVPNAVGNRDAAFALWIVAIGASQDTDAAMKFADHALAGLAPWSTGGAYLNFMSAGDATESGTRVAYSAADYERLRAIKGKVDPANRFRLNHNVPPRPLG
jgi:FAD/FMN-containing dehydrogenase